MNEEVLIKEVTTKAQRRIFVDYPNQLYKDEPNFVPAFYGDDLADWDPKKNPAFEYCEAKSFLAYRGGKVVGRIGAILSHRSNEEWGTKRMRFSQVDFIDDKAVSKALFEAVEDWARQKGCTELHGPLGFCDMDREGMLVEGFDKRSMFITYYNHPYYLEHMAALGFEKDADWIEYNIPVPEKGDAQWQKIHRLAGAVLKRHSFKKLNLKTHRQVKHYIKQVFDLVNEAYGNLYSVVPLTDAQITKYVNKFLPLVNMDYCCLIADETGKLVAFGVCAPSMAEAMKKSRGRLFPTGWARVLRSLRKNTSIDMLLIAVKPEHQGKGINAVIMDHIMQSCIKNGIRNAETGPQLELNDKILSQWKMFHLEPHKRRRSFIKSIDGTQNSSGKESIAPWSGLHEKERIKQEEERAK